MIFGEALQQIAALDDSLQKLALWKLAGYTNEEIASEKMMHCALRTVERKLNRIREIWDKAQSA
jgi:DNA-directed RNA polymerase specialized sigma24 family protein